MIYFLQVKPNGLVKIGFVKSKEGFNSRKSIIQTGCPYELKVIRTLEGSFEDESILHRFFAAKHIRGEWFEFTSKMLSISLEKAKVSVEKEGFIFPARGRQRNFVDDGKPFFLPQFYLEDFDQDEFTTIVRAFMVKNNISTRQFPDILGTPYTSFCRIERNEHGLTIKTAQSLLHAMRDYKPQRRIVSSKKS